MCADRYALTIKYTISRISALDSNKAIHLSKIILQSLLFVFALIPKESKEMRVVLLANSWQSVEELKTII